MSETSTVVVREAVYIDPRAGNDKFYRVYAFGNRWVTQYGRNGTVGTFTKIVTAADDAAAGNAADAKFASKVKKGYEPTRSGTIIVAGDIDADTLDRLDSAAESLPGSGDIPVAGLAAAPTVDVAEVLPDKVSDVVSALAAHPGDPATDNDIAPSLPVRPMLALSVPAAEVGAAMASPAWVAQFKYDGDRVVIEVSGGELRVLNRQGQAKVRNVGHTQLRPFTALGSGRWVFDGEIVGRTLVLFDLAVATDGTRTWVNEQTRFAVRHEVLHAIVDVLGIPQVADAGSSAPVVAAPIAVGEDEKGDYLAAAKAQQREGLILRHSDGVYEQGRRSTYLLKYKLIKDADVVVTALNPNRQSADLAVHNADGDLVPVGSASTIGKDDVQAGQVWVVTFLYVADPQHPRMVQPRLVRARTDKTAAECVLDQFASAGTNKAI